MTTGTGRRDAGEGPAKGARSLVALHRVADWLPPSENWVSTQLRNLPPEIASHVVCDVRSDRGQFPWPHVHPWHRSTAWDSAMRRRFPGAYRATAGRHLARQARRLRPDVLHSHFANVAWASAQALGPRLPPHVITCYGFDISLLPRQRPEWRDRYRDVFAGAARVLCEGPHMAGVVRDLATDGAAVQVHPLGVDAPSLRFQPLPWTPGEPLRILMAARFREKKGIPYALQAIARLAGEVPVEATLVGSAGDESSSQAEAARIEGLLTTPPLDRIVRRLPFLDLVDLRQEARRHHVFLQASVTASDGDTEGGAPVAILEMMAAGLIVVATRHCDIPFQVEDGRSGLLAGERDVAGLVGRLRWLVDHPDRWEALRAAARARIETNFDARTQGKVLAAIYQEVALGR